jgi:putative hydrolase of HD superfamily
MNPSFADRLERQVMFVREVDKLKNVLRMCRVTDNSRRENTAEHSWHFALMVSVLCEQAHEPINELHTIKMALIHDIVEIDAGDTYCYDEAGHEDKEDREQAAARRIFSLLPNDQSQELWSLWQEFEGGQTPESRFARAIDRLNPFMLNYYSGGDSWKENGVSRTQVMRRMGEIQTNAPKLWPYVAELINSAVERGWIQDT